MCTHFNMLRFKTFKGAMLFETRPFKEGDLGFFWQTFCHLKKCYKSLQHLLFAKFVF